MSKFKAAIVLLVAGGLSACASASADVKPTYVSSIGYEKLSCAQIETEARQISTKVAELSGIQDQKRSNDAVVTGVGIIVTPLALLMLNGNDHNTAELARMKGEFETLRKVNTAKNCGLVFEAPKPVAPPKTEFEKREDI